MGCEAVEQEGYERRPPGDPRSEILARYARTHPVIHYVTANATPLETGGSMQCGPKPTTDDTVPISSPAEQLFAGWMVSASCLWEPTTTTG